MKGTTRKRWIVEATSVEHVCKPLRNKNGPHLGDLRAFVKACDGLPDDLRVFVDEGQLSESGRRDVSYSVRQESRRALEPYLPEPDQ